MYEHDNLSADQTIRDYMYAHHKKDTQIRNGMSIDSRTIQPGQIFVAIKGNRVNGEHFAIQALTIAQSFVITENVIAALPLSQQLVVRDIQTCLQLIAQQMNNCQLKIAVTGSAGKTSTVDLIHFTLTKLGVKCYKGTLNSPSIGIQLSIINCPTGTDVGVFELGMSEQGEIAHSAALLKPDIGVITCIQSAHLGAFHDIEGIIDAKGELIPYCRKWILAPGRYYNAVVDIDTLDDVQITTHPNLAFRSSYKIVLKIVQLLRLNEQMALQAMESYQHQAGRGRITTIGSCTIYDESYNSNVDAAINSVRCLAAFPHANKVAILGSIGDLGEFDETEHARLIAALSEHTDMQYITYGPSLQGLGDHVDDILKLIGKIHKHVKPDTVFLIKGSNMHKLHLVTNYLHDKLTSLADIDPACLQ